MIRFTEKRVNRYLDKGEIGCENCTNIRSRILMDTKRGRGEVNLRKH